MKVPNELQVGNKHKTKKSMKNDGIKSISIGKREKVIDSKELEHWVALQKGITDFRQLICQRDGTYQIRRKSVARGMCDLSRIMAHLQ